MYSICPIRTLAARFKVKHSDIWHKIVFFRLIGGHNFRALVPPVRWNKDIVVSREYHTEQSQEQTEVRQNKPGDHHRVVSQGIEFRIREAEHNGQNRRADVPE